MKFTCTQENLNRGLLVVSHIAGRSATLPILNNVLIKVDSGFIKLSTTNLEIGVSATVRGRVEKGGEFTVQAKLLADYINLLPKENIELELEDQTLYIRSDNYKTYIKGVDSTDFPLIPDMAREESVTLKAKDFRKALAGVVFAAAMDESRPEISGIFFSFSGKTLTLVGTDSYRLAEAKISLAQEVSEKKLIVPLRTLQEVYRILTESSESEITLFVNENQILFK
ncbi:MAG TPA: DNA polymerase III subunit beta, partial [Patescibacteria group bacterium]|nr:DNA polymerase III subunit beta [Patescibacteria group bacterium]